MKKWLRVSLIVTAVAFILAVGLLAFFGLVVTDVVTFTEKSQTFGLADGSFLNLYRKPGWETVGIYFEVKDEHQKKLLLQKTSFDIDSDIRVGDGEKWTSTSESRTTYIAYIGKKSGIVGLARAREPEIIKLLLDIKTKQYVAPIPWGQGITNVQMAQALLLRLKEEFPERAIALDSTDEARSLRQKETRVGKQ